MTERTNASFMTTHWTALAALDGDDPTVRDSALAALTERYWPPVYAYLRRQGLGRDAAAELAQSFFVDVVLGRDLFARAEKGRGRLRGLLLSALHHHRIDEFRRDGARRLARSIVEAEERRLSACHDADANRTFERRWALAIFDETLHRCRRHFVDGGRAAHWALFEARVLAPASSGNEPPALAEIPATAMFGGPGAASAALQVVKRRFEALFREVISETISLDEDLEDEVRRVQAWFAGA